MPIFNATSTGRTGTIQTWAVPETGKYRIIAHGAPGGQGDGLPGGRGAMIQGDFNLTIGEIIYILVGQSGGSRIGSGNAAGGGGGGSFVMRGTGTSNPLIIAAGGSGGSWASHQHPGVDGGTSWVVGDTLGGSGHSRSGGGGGLTGNGNGSYIGYSYSTGGAGGTSAWGGDAGAGGFGGGGGTQFEGGGGGGYRGGSGPASNAYSTTGIAATSFNAGQNQFNSTGAAVGRVEIFRANNLPLAPINIQVTNAPVPGGDPANVQWTHNDPDGDPQSKYQLRWRKL